MVARLPLYPTPPRAPIEIEAPRARNPGCRRCPEYERAKNVCVPAYGSQFLGPSTGAIVVVQSAPMLEEDYPDAKPAGGAAGRFLRGFFDSAGATNVVWAFAARCAQPRGEVEKDRRGDAIIAGCRTYLAEDIKYVRPSRVIALGDAAARAIFGPDAPRTKGVRRAYGWIGGSVEGGAPVFLLPPAELALQSRTYRPQYVSDLVWALREAPQPPPWRGTYGLITTPEEAEEVAADIRRKILDGGPGASLVLDTETSGLLWTRAFTVLDLSLAVTSEPDHGWLLSGGALASPAVRAPIMRLLADPTVPKSGQNVKYDLNAVYTAFKVEIRGVLDDSQVESRLVDPECDADLDTLGWTVGCGGHKQEAHQAVTVAAKAVTKATKAAVKAEAQGQGSLFGAAHAPVVIPTGGTAKSVAFGLMAPDVRGRYCARDSTATARNVNRLRAAFAEEVNRGPRRVWELVSRGAVEAFSRMEARGFPCDVGALLDTADRVGERIGACREAIEKHAPGLDPNSSADIAELLYQRLGLTTSVETDSGALSTSADALKENADRHPVVPHLILYSELNHLRNTYLDGTPAAGKRYGDGGMLRHIRADGCVHSTYNITGARSGRLSSSDPNLQNIPRAEYDPKDPDTVFGKLIKDLFYAPPGWTWLQLDYSQLELRVAAILSQDPVMAEIFASLVDYHLRTAELIAPIAFGVSPAQWAALTDKERKPFRSRAKTVNFGLLYGMTVKGLAKRMGCDIPTAQKTVNAILGRMVRLHKWLEGQKQEAATTGEVWTMWDGERARRRPLHHMEFRDNVAVNSPVQGTASDFCLASVVSIDAALEYEGLRDVARLVGTVHDSILLLVRKPYAQEVAYIVKGIMEGWLPDDAPVKLVADVDIGDRLGSLKTYELAA